MDVSDFSADGDLADSWHDLAHDDAPKVGNLEMIVHGVTTKKRRLSTDEKKSQMAAREIEKAQKKREKEIAKAKREEAKMEEKKRKLEKKEEEEYEKKKRRLLQEAQRHAKPGECIKMMTVILDPGVMRLSCASAVLESFKSAGIRYDVQSQVIEGMITFWREVTEVIDSDGKTLETQRREVMEDQVIILVPLTEFISLVQQQYLCQEGQACGISLKQWYQEKQSLIDNKKITLIVQGLEKYFSMGNSKQKSYKKAVESGSRKNGGCAEVTQRQVEEAALVLQLSARGHIRFVENDAEVGQMVLMFTKAIAEAPFKRDRLDTGLTIFTDGSGSVKVSRDGDGLKQLWRQQLQQFNNVTAEVANAIMAQYPSPCSLHQAYKTCETTRQGELLLQDIVVRRGVGVLATSRRVGPELSRKIYLLYTATDPDVVIK